MYLGRKQVADSSRPMIMFCLEKSNGFCDSLSFLCGCGEELGLDVFGSYICWSQVYRVGGFLVFHQFFLQKCWLRYGGVSEPELSFVRGDVSCVCFNCPCGCCCHGMLSQEMLVFWLSSCMAFVYHSACLIRDADRQVFCSVGGEDWSCGM